MSCDYQGQIDALHEKMSKQKELLCRYFSRDMVEQILNDEIATGISGAHEEATILFFDLRGSTTIAENLSPMIFSQLLSELFTDIMDLIYGNGGSVNKMLGDGMMATYGVPIHIEHAAVACARTAVQIREYLDTFNDVRPEYLKEPLRCGMGIASGKVFAGNIGSIRRMEYTVLGDAVNTSARLENLTKNIGHDILIDGATALQLGKHATMEFVEDITIRGKSNSIDIYKLIACE